ncbi:MAG: hypothetical protein ABI647_21240, partial [Gemmatimonadota bacterium]
MTFVCLSIPAWPIGAERSTELLTRLARAAPRIKAETERIWLDARSLDPNPLIDSALRALGELGIAAGSIGIATSPIAAQVAAQHGAGPRTIVPAGTDREYLAPFPLEVLVDEPPQPLFSLLTGVGVETCAELAVLDPESVEVRFGRAGMDLWRLARADDPRPIFSHRLRELPSASLEWVEYGLDRQEQVVFIIHSLLGTVCDGLKARGQGARVVALEFALTDRSTVTHPIRSTAPTGDRRTWIRLIRTALENVTFSAPVTRIALRVDSAAALLDRQGDLFDRGFATARATEAALTQLLNEDRSSIVTAHPTSHPLPEKKIRWKPEPAPDLGDEAQRLQLAAESPSLAMQLYPAPREIEVVTELRRSFAIPARYRDGRLQYLLRDVMGPDCISGGFGDAPFSRE